MKKYYFSLIFCFILALKNPLFAMEAEQKEASSQPKKCRACTGELWPIDPNHSLANGDFTLFSDELMLFMTKNHFPIPVIEQLPFACKKMSNFIQHPDVWKERDQKNVVHLDRNVYYDFCNKNYCLKNYRYFEKCSSYLFTESEKCMECRVKNPLMQFFMKNPCESTWYPDASVFNRKKTDKSFAFSLGQRKFEMLVKEGGLILLELGRNSYDAEYILSSTVGCFCISLSDTLPLCVIRELKSLQ